MLSLTFVFDYSVLSCQGAWLHPLFSLVEVAFCPELSENKYLGLQLDKQVLCVGASHPLRSCTVVIKVSYLDVHILGACARMTRACLVRVTVII